MRFGVWCRLWAVSINYMRSFFRFVIFCLLVFGVLSFVSTSAISTPFQPAFLSERDEPFVEPFTFVMVGDVMLGRHVRKLMRANGEGFPFVNTAPLFDGADVVVVNLEGPITELDAPDARVSEEFPFSMRFAFDPVAASALADAGVTHVSLANNHAGDQGAQGRKDTRTHLEHAGIAYFGALGELAVGSVAHLRPTGHDITIIGLDATVAPLDISGVAREIASFGTSTHIVAFMHWGDEYQPIHNATQEAIAHALVDAGVDAVVGSHPHVVQDIEVYKGAPIFYSLGNFIFDQYWNDNVESGLALRIEHTKDGESYELIPVDGNHSQPTLMEEPARQAFLDALALRSQGELAESIRVGVIDIPVER